MTKEESILNRVRALLAQAEDPGATEHEAEAFTAKATELMAKYGIDEALAAQRENRQETPANIIVDIATPYAGPKAILLHVVAKAFHCKTVRLDRGKQVHVFGFKSDLEVVQILYTSLLLQAANGVLRVERQTTSWGKSRTRSARSSFLIGFAAAVNERLEATQVKAEETSEPGTALVLRSRDVAVQDESEKHYPNQRQIRVSVSNTSGYGRGHAAGQRANLHNRPETGGSSRPAIH